MPLEEPIDLLNVAFENPRKIQVQSEGNIGGLDKKGKRIRERALKFDTLLQAGSYNHDYLVPDRVTGLNELEELRRLCPERIWNFVSSLLNAYHNTFEVIGKQVEVDVPYRESQARRPLIEASMWPSLTVMDLVSRISFQSGTILLIARSRVLQWHCTLPLAVLVRSIMRRTPKQSHTRAMLECS